MSFECFWRPVSLILSVSAIDYDIDIYTGVDVDIHSLTDGATPLYWAVGRGYNEVIDILIAHGANVTKRQIGGGGFPLLYSVIKGQHIASWVTYRMLTCCFRSISSDQAAPSS